MSIQNKWLLGFALFSAGALGIVSNASAAIVALDYVKADRLNKNDPDPSGLNADKYARNVADTANLFNTRGDGSAGEFRIREVTSSGGIVGDGGDVASATFKAFCLEATEFITLGATYQVSGIDAYAEKGGVDSDSNVGSEAGAGRDYLSNATKWLYGAYRTNSLDTDVPGYNYDNNADANALQDAIWWLEKEISGTLTGLALSLKDWAVLATGGSAAAAGGNPYTDGGIDFNTQGRGTVAVLNLIDASKNEKQSQTFYIPVGGGGSAEGDVPEPISLAIWGSFSAIGLVVRGFRRRRSAKV